MFVNCVVKVMPCVTVLLRTGERTTRHSIVIFVDKLLRIKTHLALIFCGYTKREMRIEVIANGINI
jgi:hypothetical protein